MLIVHGCSGGRGCSSRQMRIVLVMMVVVMVRVVLNWSSGMIVCVILLTSNEEILLHQFPLGLIPPVLVSYDCGIFILGHNWSVS